MYLVSSLHVGPYPSWASDEPWTIISKRQHNIKLCLQFIILRLFLQNRSFSKVETSAPNAGNTSLERLPKTLSIPTSDLAAKASNMLHSINIQRTSKRIRSSWDFHRKTGVFATGLEEKAPRREVTAQGGPSGRGQPFVDIEISFPSPIL